MKVFFDTEFTGLHKDTELISLGCVDEDGRTFYAETDFFLNGFRSHDDKEWIGENVLPGLKFQELTKGGGSCSHYLGLDVEMAGSKKQIASVLSWWLSRHEKVFMWSDCLSYDWVLFNNLWGHAFDVPENVYYIPFDICTLMELKGVDPGINREDFAGMTDRPEKHNAMWDAKVIKACYEKLILI